jgi:DNA repair exonuclease SbcCD ATPase subunit
MSELDILETDIGLLQRRSTPLSPAEAADLAKKHARANELAKMINEASANYPELEDFIRKRDPSGAVAWDANPYRNVDAITRGEELKRLEAALKEAKVRGDQIEAEMGSLKPSAPRGQSLQSLESEAQEAEAQAERAAREAAEAQESRRAKERDLQGWKEEEEKARKEVGDLEAQAGETQPEHGTHPTQDPGGIVQGLKHAAAQAGKKYETMFGKEQPPEEVAAILMQCKRSVADSLALLNRLLAEYDRQLSSLSGLKQKLDDCIARESGG